MKKTKTIIKKTKESKTKQKQKQSVHVNVNIDQSKRVTQRKAKQKPDSAVNPTTTLPHGENYVKSYIPSLPPVVYQQPQQIYGNLQPVNNISDAMIRAIRSDQFSNGYHPNYNPHGNSIGQSIENQKYKDETERKSANAIVQFLEDYEVDEPDEEVEVHGKNEQPAFTPLSPSPPPSTTILSSSSSSPLDSNDPQTFSSAENEYSTLGKKEYRAKLADPKLTGMKEMRKIANSLDLDSSQRRELLLPLIMKKLKEKN